MHIIVLKLCFNRFTWHEWLAHHASSLRPEHWVHTIATIRNRAILGQSLHQALSPRPLFFCSRWVLPACIDDEKGFVEICEMGVPRRTIYIHGIVEPCFKYPSISCYLTLDTKFYPCSLHTNLCPCSLYIQLHCLYEQFYPHTLYTHTHTHTHNSTLILHPRQQTPQHPPKKCTGQHYSSYSPPRLQPFPLRTQQ